ncbi:hypothetical protein Q7P37_001457 [Cladosporium fusiforme]
MDPDSQAWRLHLHYRGPYTPEAIDSNLHLETVPRPTIQETQVLVRMHAAALNFRDLLVATADPRYPSEAATDGLVPLCDGAGTIAEIGSTSSQWKVGDKVVLASNTSWKAGQSQAVLNHHLGLGTHVTQGLLQQYCVVEEDGMAPMPGNLSFEEAACLAVPYGTAWNALFAGPEKLEKGSVLVTQGTGGVSIAALQIDSALGAKVIALTTSQEKEELLKDLGASLVINSRAEPSWSDQVLAHTDGKGADHVLEVIGPATIKESLRATKQAGLVSIVGFLSQSEKHDLIPDILFGAKTVRGLMNGSLGMLREMTHFVEQHAIKPVVAKAFPWTHAREAYKELMDQRFVGKIVIQID